MNSAEKVGRDASVVMSCGLKRPVRLQRLVDLIIYDNAYNKSSKEQRQA